MAGFDFKAYQRFLAIAGAFVCMGANFMDPRFLSGMMQLDLVSVLDAFGIDQFTNEVTTAVFMMLIPVVVVCMGLLAESGRGLPYHLAGCFVAYAFAFPFFLSRNRPPPSVNGLHAVVGTVAALVAGNIDNTVARVVFIPGSLTVVFSLYFVLPKLEGAANRALLTFLALANAGVMCYVLGPAVAASGGSVPAFISMARAVPFTASILYDYFFVVGALAAYVAESGGGAGFVLLTVLAPGVGAPLFLARNAKNE